MTHYPKMKALKLFAALSIAAIPMLGAGWGWKTATLTEVRALEPFGQAFAFDLGDKILVCSGKYMWRIKPVQAEVGSKVQYVRKGSTLTFLDSNGKEQKCDIQHEALKPTPAP